MIKLDSLKRNNIVLPYFYVFKVLMKGSRFMRKRDMTFASAVLEAIDAILALAYIGLQIYYGVCYHIQVFKFVANILVLLLVYIAITWLQHYPEKLNHIAAELCVGNIRKYSLRLLTFVKLVFTAGLLVP